MGAVPAHYANLKKWPKGVSGNPGGRPKLPEHLKNIPSLTATEVNKLISKYGRLTYGQLNAALLNKELPVLDLAIAGIFLDSIDKHNYMSLNFLLDRAIGKAPILSEELEDADKLDVSKMSIKELLILVKNAIPDSEKIINESPINVECS